MKIKLLLILLIAITVIAAAKDDRAAYRIFNAKGKKVSYEDLLKAAEGADIIFFGELHDNPICHWLELRLTKDLYNMKKERHVLGAEMFERDNQLLLNEYISKMIRKKDFEAEAKLWKNYQTDYAPIVDFAVENKINFVATSIPRRFAAIVNRSGFEGLDSINAVERGLIAPLPVKFNPELDCYKKMKEMMGPDPAGSHMSDNIERAQAIKDATMAHFILKNGYEGRTFLHFNGSYHSDHHQGIVWYINYYNRKTEMNLKVVTISCVEQKSTANITDENLGVADFIICIPDDMTKTMAPSGGSAPSSSMKPATTTTPAAPIVKHDSVTKPAADTTDDDEGEEGDND